MLYLLVHSSFCLSLGCTLLHTGTRAAAPASHRNVSILRCQRNTVWPPLCTGKKNKKKTLVDMEGTFIKILFLKLTLSDSLFFGVYF